MKAKKIYIVFFTLTLLQSCFVGYVKTFTSDDLKWFEAYDKLETLVFESDNGEMDTIIFHKIDTTKYSVRDIEQGFYDRTTLSVAYEFTKGSYHQFAKMSDDSVLYEHDLINISNSSSSDFTAKEFTFIGIIFNGKEINNIKQLDNSTYFFERSKATYTEIDVEKGINNFTFEIKKGIIKYTDKRNVNWKRI
jgi:hypothetical protein